VDRPTFIVAGLRRMIVIDHNVIDHKGVVRVEHHESAALRRRHPSAPTRRPGDIPGMAARPMKRRMMVPVPLLSSTSSRIHGRRYARTAMIRPATVARTLGTTADMTVTVTAAIGPTLD
jgi:hypothetical protein